MPEFSIQEINLMCLYEGINRRGTIRNLKRMMTFLAPDEEELRSLTESTLQKLRVMKDEDYDFFALHYLVL